MTITFCECLSCSMEVKHPGFSFRVRLQGDINCRDSDHAVPSTVCFWYPQQLSPTAFNTSDQKKSQKLSSSSGWHFWTKVYQLQYNILVQISGSFFLCQKPHTWGQVRAAESRDWGSSSSCAICWEQLHYFSKSSASSPAFSKHQQEMDWIF